MEIEKRKLENQILSNHCVDVNVVNVEGKGVGLVANETIRNKEFIVEYAGDLVDGKEGEERERVYQKQNNPNCCMYSFEFANKKYCIDATPVSRKLGRLVNHSKMNPNCKVKIVDVRGVPHLVLFSIRDIEIGEEILYDYGDRNKDSIKAHPFLLM